MRRAGRSKDAPGPGAAGRSARCVGGREEGSVLIMLVSPWFGMRARADGSPLGWIVVRMDRPRHSARAEGDLERPPPAPRRGAAEKAHSPPDLWPARRSDAARTRGRRPRPGHGAREMPGGAGQGA